VSLEVPEVLIEAEAKEAQRFRSVPAKVSRDCILLSLPGEELALQRAEGLRVEGAERLKLEGANSPASLKIVQNQTSVVLPSGVSESDSQGPNGSWGQGTEGSGGQGAEETGGKGARGKGVAAICQQPWGFSSQDSVRLLFLGWAEAQGG